MPFVPAEIIEKRIFLIRGRKVMLDVHLAELYGVSTGVLNQAVRRNADRFPSDFMFQLAEKEVEALRLSQIVTTSQKYRRITRPPHAFTEQGIAMLSSVLRSKRAIEVNIVIMRIFARLREMLSAYKELVQKVEALEQKYSNHDEDIHAIFLAIKKLLNPPEPAPVEEKRPMGFSSDP